VVAEALPLSVERIYRLLQMGTKAVLLGLVLGSVIFDDFDNADVDGGLLLWDGVGE
jgi:hypothetical protein